MRGAVAAGQPVLLPQPLGDPSPHHCGTCLGAKATPPSATLTPVQSGAPTVSCIHYKFSSKLSCDTVTFHGVNIALGNLKQQIMSHEKLKVASCDLQITNTQTEKGV